MATNTRKHPLQFGREVGACVDTYAGYHPSALTRTSMFRGPPYCAHGLRVPPSCVLYVLEAQGSLPPGPHAPYVRGTRTSLGLAVRTAYRGTSGPPLGWVGVITSVLWRDRRSFGVGGGDKQRTVAPQVVANILGKPQLADWKKCLPTPTPERPGTVDQLEGLVTEEFKALFAPFDPMK